jgi:hypothetical protein
MSVPLQQGVKETLSWNLNLIEAYLKMYRKHSTLTNKSNRLMF